jgi:hypothetical protein
MRTPQAPIVRLEICLVPWAGGISCVRPAVYGVVVDCRPDRCPMCGGETWEFTSWEPFSHSNAHGLRETNS